MKHQTHLKKVFVLLLLLSILCNNAHCLAATEESNQYILVEYLGGTTAIVSFYEKNEQGLWEKLYTTTGYVGKNGMGKTTEWDYKTPVGTFELGQAFGIKKNPGTKLDYVKVNRYHYSVDDHNYPDYYNTLVDVRDLGVASLKGEHLINYGKSYHYAIWIQYNKEKVVGNGSSIFLHCYSSHSYTQGCVAIPESMMVKFLKRLNQDAKIIIR